jgi:hypothetical protein
MRPDDLHVFTRKTPFQPFRIVTTDGRTYDIFHPDLVIVMRSRLVIGVGVENGEPEHLEHVALLHVVRVEEIPAEKSKTDGNGEN